MSTSSYHNPCVGCYKCADNYEKTGKAIPCQDYKNYEKFSVDNEYPTGEY